MGKGAVFTVTGFASSCHGAAQHIGLIGAVSGVAVAAVVGLRMNMERLLAALELVGVAAATHATGNPF